MAPKGRPKVLKRLKAVKSVKTGGLKGIVEGKLEMEWEGTRGHGRDAPLG